MKKVLSISFWLAAILLVAAVMTSLRYRFAESVFIGTLFLMAHYVLQVIRADSGNIYAWADLPDLLSNPVFIAIMISALAVGNYFFEKWLAKRYPSEKKPVTFLSERKPVSLMTDDILFVESNDAITTVVATEDRHYRNNTHIESFDKDSVQVGGCELPVSRKYLKTVKEVVN